MFRRFGYALLIVAVLAATGTHWIVLQSVAWTTMLAGNLGTTSVYQAVERTFDGQHPCCLCKQIRAGKQTEKKSEFHAGWKKLEFSYAVSAFRFEAPSHFYEVRAIDDTADLFAHAPPVPPPRQLPG